MLTPKLLVSAGIGLVLILFGAWLALSAQDLAWPKFFVNHETLINPTEETKAADMKKNGEWMDQEWRYEMAGLACVGVGSAIVLLHNLQHVAVEDQEGCRTASPAASGVRRWEPGAKCLNWSGIVTRRTFGHRHLRRCSRCLASRGRTVRNYSVRKWFHGILAAGSNAPPTKILIANGLTEIRDNDLDSRAAAGMDRRPETNRRNNRPSPAGVIVRPTPRLARNVVWVGGKGSKRVLGLRLGPGVALRFTSCHEAPRGQ